MLQCMHSSTMTTALLLSCSPALLLSCSSVTTALPLTISVHHGSCTSHGKHCNSVYDPHQLSLCQSCVRGMQRQHVVVTKIDSGNNFFCRIKFVAIFVQVHFNHSSNLAHIVDDSSCMSLYKYRMYKNLIIVTNLKRSKPLSSFSG